MPEERLTWEQIQEKYPDQWLGLKDCKMREDNNIMVESAIVAFSNVNMYDESVPLPDGLFDKGILIISTTPDKGAEVGVLV